MFSVNHALCFLKKVIKCAAMKKRSKNVDYDFIDTAI